MVEKCQNLRNEIGTRWADSLNLLYWGHIINKSLRSYIYIYVYNNYNIYIYIYIILHFFLNIYIYIYICIKIYVHIYIYIYIHLKYILYYTFFSFACSYGLGRCVVLHFLFEALVTVFQWPGPGTSCLP